MASPTGCSRILQVHPTRRCNLQCLHCYSLSGPGEREEIEVALLLGALADASQAGYDVASFSGGEPLMYKELRTLLDHSHDCGMLTTVTTNGMLLTPKRLEMLTGRADLLAISLDGTPESHNVIRASKRAFDDMAANLENLRETGIKFGFIFTLTQYNLDELEWVAAFALEQGASLLQIHPLEDVGRARAKMPGEHPDNTESACAVVEALQLQETIGDRMVVHVDLVDREYLKTDPARVFADELPEDLTAVKFADVVSPLVIEPDGGVVPIQYGFARTYALGNLHEDLLSRQMERWRREKLPHFRELCRNVFCQTTAPAELPFFNWYEVLGETAANPQQ